MALQNKQRKDAIIFLTSLQLNKHDFMNLHNTQRRLLGAADLFEVRPCLKLDRLFSLGTAALILALLLAWNIRNLGIST